MLSPWGCFRSRSLRNRAAFVTAPIWNKNCNSNNELLLLWRGCSCLLLLLGWYILATFLCVVETLLVVVLVFDPSQCQIDLCSVHVVLPPYPMVL